MDYLKTLKFIKGPGYLYDLFSLFILYFNQNVFLSEQVNQNKAVEDTEHFNRVLNTIEKIPEELRVFFQLKEDRRSFFTSFFFHNNIEKVLLAPGIDTIQRSLKDYDNVIINVIDYYFGSDVITTSFDSPEFIRTIGKKIRDSEYDLALKNNLYEFFLDPIPIIQTLCNELSKKEILLSKIYSDNDLEITKVQNKINIESVSKKLLQNKNLTVDITSFNEIIVSFCVVHKNCIGAFISEDEVALLLGTDYEDFSDFLITKNRTPELVQLGIALSENNRIQILEFIHNNGEVSVADIKSRLQFSHTNAYYHITLLLKSNLLRVRNCGRTVYYSINREYFKDVCTMLGKYKERSE